MTYKITIQQEFLVELGTLSGIKGPTQIEFMCKSFNDFILKARHKNIITILEDIRRLIMKRNVNRRAYIAK